MGKVLNKKSTNVKGYIVISKCDYDSGNFDKVFKGRTKDVYQYDLEGNLVDTYSSLASVYHKNNNYKTNHIHTACKNLWVHKNFIWSYGELLNIKEVVEKKKKYKNGV